ncbi:hypothetical protein WN73_06860 [Bradyrhizobium sp. CCBAU 45394]|nr:hypothetical protein [Bradyrhizobium sp. CCBAU 45394]
MASQCRGEIMIAAQIVARKSFVELRIASHIDAPGRDQLPHLFCSWPELRRRPGAEMAGVSERPASSAGTAHVIGVL